MLNEFAVVPREGSWVVEWGGRVVARHDSRLEALFDAIERARELNGAGQAALVRAEATGGKPGENARARAG